MVVCVPPPAKGFISIFPILTALSFSDLPSDQCPYKRTTTAAAKESLCAPVQHMYSHTPECRCRHFHFHCDRLSSFFINYRIAHLFENLHLFVSFAQPKALLRKNNKTVHNLTVFSLLLFNCLEQPPQQKRKSTFSEEYITTKTNCQLLPSAATTTTSNNSEVSF